MLTGKHSVVLRVRYKQNHSGKQFKAGRIDYTKKDTFHDPVILRL